MARRCDSVVFERPTRAQPPRCNCLTVVQLVSKPRNNELLFRAAAVDRACGDEILMEATRLFCVRLHLGLHFEPCFQNILIIIHCVVTKLTTSESLHVLIGIYIQTAEYKEVTL